MPKEEWGVKRVCPNCQSRFYDLQNDPMTCPECGHSFTAESLASGKARTMVADKADPKSAAATEDDDDAVVLDDDDDDDAVVEESDDDVLDDDDDEVPLDEIADVSSDEDDDS